MTTVKDVPKSLPPEVNREIERKIMDFKRNSSIQGVDIHYSILSLPAYCPMYLSASLDSEMKHIQKVIIAVNRSYLDHVYFDFSLGHELGHAEKLVADTKDGCVISAPNNLWQHIKSDLAADKFVLQHVLNGSDLTKKQMKKWLWLKITGNIRELLQKSDEHKGIFKDIILNASRLVVCWARK